MGEARGGCGVRSVDIEGGRAEFEPEGSPENGDGELDERIAEADPKAALAAAAAQEKPTEQRQIFPPGEGVVAGSAVRAGGSDVLALRHAGKDDVEKAAEGEAEERGKDGAEELEELREAGGFGHG